MNLNSVKAALRRRQYKKQLLESSMILEARYIEEQAVLVIQFVGGKHYAYDGVGKAVWTKLIKADSVGQFFHTRINHHYPFKQIRNTEGLIDSLPEVKR